MHISQIPTQFIIIKDLIFRESNLRQILDYLNAEIINLEDEQSGVEQKIIQRYSVNAGIQSIAIPNFIGIEENANTSQVPEINITKPSSLFNSSEKSKPISDFTPIISNFEEAVKTKPKGEKNKKIKKLQKELKDCQLDRDSKNDQIDMLKSAIKNKNKEVDGLNEELTKIDILQERLVEMKEHYDRLQIENEILIDRLIEADPSNLGNADETILSMILCQSIAVENAISSSKR